MDRQTDFTPGKPELRRSMSDSSEPDWAVGATPRRHAEGVSIMICDVSNPLLNDSCNGRRTPSRRGSKPQITTSSVDRIKDELSEVVCWRVRLWMVIVLIFVLIVLVILASLAVCAATHEDADEKFDSSLFTVPLSFNGSFQLPNLVFTEELFTPSSSRSQALTAELQEKLAEVYRASPALGRYFSKAEVYAFRNGSVIADYQLTFVMPDAQQDQLRSFTLSREMVYNVFRQFLYDQEPNESELFIDPVSLNM